MGKYTDEQLRWLVERGSKSPQWAKVSVDFLEEFDLQKSPNALRKCYDTYQDADLSVDSLSKKSMRIRTAENRSRGLANEVRALQDTELTLCDIEKRLHGVVDGVNYRLYKAPKPEVPNKVLKRALVAHFSDAHFGNNIDKAELLINEYNSKIASSRTAFYFNQLVNYKRSDRSETGLVLLLNGDMLQGVIHNQEGNLDLITIQFETIISVLSQGISFLANEFPKVTVLCTTGNHDRFMHKSNKARQTAQKWDSFASLAYIALKNVFDNSYPNVDFVVRKTPYIDYTVLGHRVFVTHGDTTFNVGNVSKNVNISAIENQINKINNSQLTKDKKFDAFFIGHVHFPMVLLSQTGCHIFINGCVSGTDPFAQSIGIFNNQVVQQFVEMTPDHIGDMRFVDLRQADNMKSMEKIIKPRGIFLD